MELDSDSDFFEVGDSFTGFDLSNLDLYLLPADADDIDDSVWSSISEEDSLEHIFIPIPETGNYKLRVVMRDAAHDAPESYALAWWAQTAQ